ncbi:2'-5' RNA ligase [Acinetobacter venetianus]|uniref:2'-5' RNA ligase family protein n=1 Tax=Acinetobacter venetianus TaxID=52133 RepID=UPI000775CB06|nr:2'-5' RNA ligase family protein [Acinetobacter venetianus]KXO78346.1 2'-5' RNA ligase [Acinetobacter venetianus]
MLLQASTQLISTERHDYPEWHHGRSDFAVWYIEIDQAEVIQYLGHIKNFFSDLLIDSNQRQYHITLFVCGFLTPKSSHYDDDFEIDTLKQQIQALNSLEIETFELEINGLDSFSSALFLQVEDNNKILDGIRQQLAQYSDEIAALEYCPHITLGLYNDAWQSDLVLDRIQSIAIKPFKIQVKYLTFGYYKAQILQGLLYPYHQIRLG